MNKSSQFPFHFWQIHKKVWQREWLTLDAGQRDQIFKDADSKVAKDFYSRVQDLAINFFEDEKHNYNSRYRFQYPQ